MRSTPKHAATTPSNRQAASKSIAFSSSSPLPSAAKDLYTDDSDNDYEDEFDEYEGDDDLVTSNTGGYGYNSSTSPSISKSPMSLSSNGVPLENLSIFQPLDVSELELQKRMMAACETGLAGELERVLANPKSKDILNVASALGDYALNMSIRAKQWGCVALLLEMNHIDTNVVDINRDTPLLLAVKLCHSGGMPWIKPLLKKGADYKARDARGKRVLDIARDNLDFECLKVLLENGVVGDLKGEIGSQWMFGASEAGNMKSISILLAAGAPANATSIDGTTALIDTLKRRYRDCAEILIEANADVNATCRSNTLKPAQLAASAGMGAVISSMLEKKLDPNTQFLLKQNNCIAAFSLLTWAVRHGDPALVRQLLERGADVNATSELCEVEWRAALSKSTVEISESSVQEKMEQVRPQQFMATSISQILPRSSTASIRQLRGLQKFRAYAAAIGKQQNEKKRLEAKLQEENRLASLLQSSPLTEEEVAKDNDPIGLGTGYSFYTHRTAPQPSLEEQQQFAHPGILEERPGLHSSISGGIAAENCRSPLMWAVAIHMLKRTPVFEEHWNLDDKDTQILSKNSKEISEEILDMLTTWKHTDLGFTSGVGESAFSIAACFGLEICLLKLVNAATSRGFAPSGRCIAAALVGSCRFGHAESLRIVMSIPRLRLPNDALTEPLLKASMYGHTECLKVIFSKARELGLPTIRGPCLHAAAIANHQSAVEFLMQTPTTEPEDRVVRENGQALLAAVKQGNYGCVATLIAHGAKVNYAVPQQQGSKTPVLVASRCWGKSSSLPHLACVSLLVRHRADVNISDKHGDTPIKWAAVQGDLAAIRMLCEAGAKVDIKDAHGNLPVAVAGLHGNEACVEDLVHFGKAADIQILSAPLFLERKHTATPWDEILKDEVYSSNRMTGPLLAVAVCNGWFGVALALLQNGANPATVTEHGQSVAFLAAGLGWKKVLEHLLHRGADPNYLWNGCTPLTWAAHWTQSECMSILLHAGAKQVQVALLASCIRGNVSGARIAIDHDYDAAKLAFGAALIFAACHQSAYSNQLSILDFMLQNVEDVNSCVAPNRELLEWCSMQAFDKMFPEEYGMKQLQVATTALNAAAASGHLVNAHKLLLAGADPRAPDALGRSPLCWAALNGAEDTVKCLIINGAQVDLHVADIRRVNKFFQGRELWRKVLLKARGDQYLPKSAPDFRFKTTCDVPDVEDNVMRLTPLLWAGIGGHVEISRILSEAGGNVEEAIGWTNSLAAVAYSCEEAVQLCKKTLEDSRDTALYGPYITCVPLLQTPQEILQDVHPKPVEGHKRVKAIEVCLSISGWSLAGVKLLYDISDDIVLSAACASGSNKPMKGSKGSVRVMHTILQPDEYLEQVEWVIGEEYLLAVRFTTNHQRHIGWYGEQDGSSFVVAVNKSKLRPKGREICGVFGKERNNRIIAMGFVTRIRHADHIYRQYRDEALADKNEWHPDDHSTAANFINLGQTLKNDMISTFDQTSLSKSINNTTMTSDDTSSIQKKKRAKKYENEPSQSDETEDSDSEQRSNPYAIVSTFAPMYKANGNHRGGRHRLHHGHSHGHHHDEENHLQAHDTDLDESSMEPTRILQAGYEDSNVRIAFVRRPQLVQHQIAALSNGKAPQQPTVKPLQKKRNVDSNMQLQAFLQTACGHKHDDQHSHSHSHGHGHGSKNDSKSREIGASSPTNQHFEVDDLSTGVGTSLEIEKDIVMASPVTTTTVSSSRRRSSTIALGSNPFQTGRNRKMSMANPGPVRIPINSEIVSKTGMVYAVQDPGPTLSKSFAAIEEAPMESSTFSQRRSRRATHETLPRFDMNESRNVPPDDHDHHHHHHEVVAPDLALRKADLIEEQATELQGIGKVAQAISESRHGIVNRLKKRLVDDSVDNPEARQWAQSQLVKLGHLQGNRTAKLQMKIKRHESKIKALLTLANRSHHDAPPSTPNSKNKQQRPKSAPLFT